MGAGHEGLRERAEARNAPRELAESQTGGKHHCRGDFLRLCFCRVLLRGGWGPGKRRAGPARILYEIGDIWKPKRTFTSTRTQGRRSFPPPNPASSRE